ncbi:hypothetical protein AN189_18520, partial [Loktanella sp. 3ANDIMAR09]|uniref:hypothetical protein n=1 Tax=Loktanella sp. 3ANDIMAR09 TaxID=1225657 RepID=UPI0007085785
NQFGPEQSKAIFGKRFNDSVGHTAQIIKIFDTQIDHLAFEMKREPRLLRALDKIFIEAGQM